MKKTAYLLVILVLSVSTVFGQNDAISTYFSHYLDDEDITKISVSGKAFELMQDVDIEGDEGKDFKKMASQVSGFRMVVDNEVGDVRSTVKDAFKKVSNSFEELIQVREKDKEVHVLVNESHGTVYEVLCIVGTDNEFILASLTGNMKLTDVGDLTKSLSTMGNDVFSETSIDASEIDIYPSPASKGQTISVDLPEGLVGGSIRIYSAGGNEVQSLKVRNKLEKLDTSNLESGVYILKSTKGELEISKKFIVQ